MWRQYYYYYVNACRLATFCCGMVAAMYAQAQQQFISQQTQTQLIELYTSEGCSSCPPADKWLSKFSSEPTLWKTIIPIAFHVDYWDYIGWPDRFASPEFASRQRQHKRLNNTRAVYTPGFVVDGNEWKGWWAHREPPESVGQPGVLSLTINDKDFNASFINEQDLNPKQLSIAVLGFGLETEVKAGENRGETLQHNFVVLGIKHYSGSEQWHGELPVVENQFDAKRLGLVAWVSNKLVPIQAVGGWID